MMMEELLKITVDNEQWLDVINGQQEPRSMVDQHKLLDYIAMKADGVYTGPDAPEDEVDNILFCFDAKQSLGMTANDFMDEFLYVAGLVDYFEECNNVYCQEEGLCTKCRDSLDRDDDGETYCPNGC